MYGPLSPQVSLPALDHAILEFWRDNKIFARSLEQSHGRPEWVFYEGHWSGPAVPPSLAARGGPLS